MEQQHYNVFFRKTRRHKWRYRNSCCATSIQGLIDLRKRLWAQLSAIPKAKGETPGFAIVRDNSGIVLISMRKATWQRIPESDKALIEPRAEEPDNGE